MTADSTAKKHVQQSVYAPASPAYTPTSLSESPYNGVLYPLSPPEVFRDGYDDLMAAAKKEQDEGDYKYASELLVKVANGSRKDTQRWQKNYTTLMRAYEDLAKGSHRASMATIFILTFMGIIFIAALLIITHTLTGGARW